MTGVRVHSIEILSLTADILQLRGWRVRVRCPCPDSNALLCM